MQIKQTIQALRKAITPQRAAKLKYIWEAFSIGILGLNSFILLYLHEDNNESIKYVICAGAFAYALIIAVQSIVYRTHPQKMTIVLRTKQIFRLIYTAVNLTAIMLDVLLVVEQPNPERELVYYGWLFIWAVLWGTNFLWMKRIFAKLRELKIHDRNL